MEEPYKIPSWAGKPPAGMHLDVLKNGSLLQKLLIDDKKCYIFGRNKDKCDFPLDHSSCSRFHAALVYHKHLERFFIVDLKSVHGTLLGRTRLEPLKPQELPVDSTISFGASTRTYILREKPKPVQVFVDTDGDQSGSGLLGLPEDETEMDDLTQFNTAHNKQISMLGITEEDAPIRRKRRSQTVNFSDTEEIINPEDIDPSIGRFRNMVQTTVIPSKRMKLDRSDPFPEVSPTGTTPTKPFTRPSTSSLYSDTGLDPSEIHSNQMGESVFTFSTSSLGIKPVSAAPPVDQPEQKEMSSVILPLPRAVPLSPTGEPLQLSPTEPHRKKYAKEAWPGRKPSHLLV